MSDTGQIDPALLQRGVEVRYRWEVTAYREGGARYEWEINRGRIYDRRVVRGGQVELRIFGCRSWLPASRVVEIVKSGKEVAA